jgi:LysR family glycine cleavage system transcriptional activator
MNLLVTFDAVARHLSFKVAADELCVSPSAVSHQIRTLEKTLNMALFTRSHRAIALTKEGASYAKAIQQAIAQITQATELLLSNTQTKKLLIHSTPFLTSQYIAPNLKSFKLAYPDVEIAIESQTQRAHFTDANHIQIALRHGKESDSDLVHHQISPVFVSPVCAPDYLDQPRRVKIQLSSDQISWQAWESRWENSLSFDEVLHCDGMQAVLDMAEQGLGIAMGYFPFTAPKIESGALHYVSPQKIAPLDAFYLVHAQKHQNEPIVMAFYDWLKTVIDSA